MRELFRQLGRALVGLRHEIQNLWHEIQNLWEVANNWARVVIAAAIAIVVFWPITIITAAFFLPPAYKRVVVPMIALAPVALGAALGIILLLAVGPLWAIVPAALPRVRRILKGFAAVIGIWFTVGVFFSLVPIPRDLSLLPLLTLTVLAIVFLRFAGIRGLLTGMLTMVAIVLFAIWFVSWDAISKEVGDAMDKNAKDTAEAAAKVQATRSTITTAKPGVLAYNLKCSSNEEDIGRLPQGQRNG